MRLALSPLHRTRVIRHVLGMLVLLGALNAPAPAQEDGLPILRKGTFEGMSEAQFRAVYPEYFGPQGRGRARPADIPDIFGPGAVLNVGNLCMKVTNMGVNGNPFPNLSSDPAGQWVGTSGVEYLSYFGLAVGAVNPLATSADAIRRVSQNTEWRPATIDPVDRIYKAYDGILNGTRFANDDRDSDPNTAEPRFDEDFLDGRDNDLDGLIDEDFAAMGQQMFSCVIRDDTPQAINAPFNERHVPIGLEVRQLAWAYSIPGFTDFNVVEWTIFNRSGHVLDSLVVGGVVDMDCGPVEENNYWIDDFDLVGYPSGVFPHQTSATDKRLQDSTMRMVNVPPDVAPDSALCSHYDIRIHAFSIIDDNGDDGKTPGIPTFMLVDHTTDPLGVTGPSRVQFLTFRSYRQLQLWQAGGAPLLDAQRFETMVLNQPVRVDAEGLIVQPPAAEKGDIGQWWSCGPWRNVPEGGSVRVTVAFGVAPGDLRTARRWPADYAAYRAGTLDGGELTLLSRYPSFANCYAIQAAFEGVFEERTDWSWLTNGHGRETPVHPQAGEGAITASDCRDMVPRTVTFQGPVDWFDFDCDYCTGAYDSQKRLGMFHRTWSADAPPPNPSLNVAASYNYSANPDRIVPAGDKQVTLAWDNLSEVTPDPKSGWLDFRGYRVWKAAGWTRPVGSAGPSDDNWALLAELRLFYYYDPTNNQLIQRNYAYTESGDSVCPKVTVPNRYFPKGDARCSSPSARSTLDGGCLDTATVEICLRLGDLWDRQSGQVIHTSPSITCVVEPTTHECAYTVGCIVGREFCGDPANRETRVRYPVGRYEMVDREVKNGYVYFYSVTAFDSTGFGQTKLELTGRRAAVEADAVVPQTSVGTGRNVWVVPNPYRGYRTIQDRPSSWDLTPNGSDPTGTHIDFLGLPRGKWTIRIYTVSGDLVQTIGSGEAVNESIRTPVPGFLPDGQPVTRPGYNTQQDNPNDGQARWNLISRNGQDIVSGIYLFTVESDAGTQRGKFVVIR